MCVCARARVCFFLVLRFACICRARLTLPLSLSGSLSVSMCQLWFLSKDVGHMELHRKLGPLFTYFFITVRCVLTVRYSAYSLSCVRMLCADMNACDVRVCSRCGLRTLLYATSLLRCVSPVFLSV